MMYIRIYAYKSQKCKRLATILTKIGKIRVMLLIKNRLLLRLYKKCVQISKKKQSNPIFKVGKMFRTLNSQREL